MTIKSFFEKLLINRATAGIIFRMSHYMEIGAARSQMQQMQIGKNVIVYPGLKTARPWNISIGDHVILNFGAVLYAHDNSKISIGEYTLIAPQVFICSVQHDMKVQGLEFRDALIESDVHIGKNVWIGARAVILPGVTVGDYAVIGAGSVVNTDVEPYSIVCGSPAKPVGKRELG